MKKFFYYILVLALACVGYSCDDNSNVGNSLSTASVAVISDSSFTVTGQSVSIPRVKARTTTQLVGAIKAEKFGNLSSEVVTEMMPVFKADTTGVTEDMIDGIRLVMFVNAKTGFTGDSIVPMRMSVYRLNKQLPEKIYSDFDPSGYYSEDDLLGSATYTASDMEKSSADRTSHFQSYYDNSSYSTKYYEIREARVNLPLELGRSLFREYKKNPSTYSSPDAFAKFFPGLYIKSSYGSGRVMHFTDSEVEVLYHRKYKTTYDTDTIVNDSASYMAVTPEIITNNVINLDVDESLKSAVAAGETILLAPQGYGVDIKLPIKDIVAKYELDDKSLRVVNQLYLEIPAYAIDNDYEIDPPASVMLIRTSEKDDFFDENKLTDGCRSYVGTYNSTKKAYTFPGMRNYIIDILKDGGRPTDNDEAISLIPVDVTSEKVSSSYSYYSSSSSSDVLTKVAPSVSKPSMARLDLTKAKIKLTYTKQETNNF